MPTCCGPWVSRRRGASFYANAWHAKVLHGAHTVVCVLNCCIVHCVDCLSAYGLWAWAHFHSKFELGKFPRKPKPPETGMGKSILRGGGMLGPSGLAARSNPPAFTLRSSWCLLDPPVPLGSPLVPFGPIGLSLDAPACPSVPLVSRGSYSSVVIVVWPAAAVPPSLGVMAPSVCCLCSLAVAVVRVCMNA
jgi:hypothetical protein